MNDCHHAIYLWRVKRPITAVWSEKRTKKCNEWRGIGKGVKFNETGQKKLTRWNNSYGGRKTKTNIRCTCIQIIPCQHPTKQRASSTVNRKIILYMVYRCWGHSSPYTRSRLKHTHTFTLELRKFRWGSVNLDLMASQHIIFVHCQVVSAFFIYLSSMPVHVHVCVCGIFFACLIVCHRCGVETFRQHSHLGWITWGGCCLYSSQLPCDLMTGLTIISFGSYSHTHAHTHSCSARPIRFAFMMC